MKIRTKLFGGFLIVATIGIILGAVGFYSNKRLSSMSAEMMHFTDARANATSILNSHYAWRHLLMEAVSYETTFTGSLDSNTCSLGRWLSSDEIKYVTDTEIISLLRQIAEPHHFIHNKAGEIVSHLNNAETVEASMKLKNEVLPKTQEVISLLEKLENRFNTMQDEIALGIYDLGSMFEFVIIVFMIVAVILCVLFAAVITSGIVNPILPLSSFMKIASTTGNIVLRDEDRKSVGKYGQRNDEIGVTISSFVCFLDKIREMVNNIKKETETLHNIGDDLANNMNQTTTTVNKITANVQSIKDRVLNQSASVSETHETMGQVVQNINKLDGLVENQSTNISQASSAIEQMAANIQSVTETLSNNAVNVQNLQEASEVGRTGLQEVAGDIQEIARESEGLMEINSVMENIASQTNLLSMNAAIEAAHAGESGKGFAVVADEIRKLAENSSEQSKTIGVVLKKIKNSIDKIIKSTENVLTKFEAIDSSVKIVSDQEEHIRNAMEEQGAGSRQVVEGIMEVNEVTRQVRSGSREMLDGSKEVIRESESLANGTREIDSSMNEMAEGTDQINIAVNHVNEISNKNREGIDILIKEVSWFKVG